MPIPDLNSWANEVELVRLPAIEAQATGIAARVEEVDDDLAAFVLSTNSTLAAHRISIDVAQSDAWTAQDEAYNVGTMVYQTGLDAHTYTDTRIEQLRQELIGRVNIAVGDLEGTITTNVTGSVTGTINDAVNRTYDALARAEQAAEDLGFHVNDVLSVTDQIIQTELPSQRSEISNLALRSLGTKSTLDLLLTDFDYPSLGDGLDAIRDDLENSVRPMTGSVIRRPANHWTIEPDSTSFTGKAVPPDSWFITNDPLFGECLDLPAGPALSFGPANHLPFDPQAVYKLTLQYRLLAAPGTGAEIEVGAVTWRSGPTLVEQSSRINVSAGNTVDEVMTVSWYITGSATKAIDLEGNLLRLISSSTGKRVFFYLRQGAGTQLRLGSLEIRDVTDAIEAADRANAIGGDAINNVLDAIDDINEALDRNAELMARLGNWRFAAGWNSWTTSSDLTADPAEMNDVLVGELVVAPGTQADGAARFTGPALLASAYSVSILPDQVFSVQLQATSSVSCEYDLILTTYSMSDVKLTEFVLSTGNITQTTPWQQFTGKKDSAWGSNATKVRISLKMKTAGAVVTVRELSMTDITAQENRARAVTARTEAFSAKEDAEEARADAILAEQAAVTAKNEAGDHALSSFIHAASASAKASESEQYASVAERSVLKAETANGLAQAAAGRAAESTRTAAGSESRASYYSDLAASARDEAGRFEGLALSYSTTSVAAKVAAENASVAAQSASGLAVSLASRGLGVLTDQFFPSAWVNWTTAPTRAANTKFPVGNQLTFAVNATTQAGVRLESTNAAWTGTVKGKSFKVEVDFLLNSGSMNGAGVLFEYLVGTSSYRVTKKLSDMVDGAVFTGEYMTAAADFPIPAGITQANVTGIRIYLMANFDSPLLGGLANKNITFYRAQIYQTTFVEAGISETRTAIADLQGNAAAGYLIKAQAGGAVSLLELIAADGSAGSVSVAKIAATNILLDGTVSLKHLTMTDWNNRVPDSELQDATMWTGVVNDGTGILQLRPTSPGSWPKSQGDIVYWSARNTTNADVNAISDYIPIGSSDELLAAGQMLRSGGTKMRAFIGLMFYNRAKEFLSATTVYSVNGTNNVSASQSANVTAPSDAAYVRIRFYVYGADTDGNVVFAGPVILKRNAAELIVDGGIYARHVNTASFKAEGLALFGGDLQSTNFNLANGTGWRITNTGRMDMPRASVGTLELNGNSVTVPASQNLSNTLAGTNAWRTVNTASFNLPQAGRVVITWFACQGYTALRRQANGLRLYIDGSLYWSRGAPGDSRIETDWLAMGWDANLSAGSHTFRIDWLGGDSDIFIHERTLIVQGSMR